MCLVMITSCISLTACGDGQNEEPEVTNSISIVNSDFSVILSEDWYKFFDIEVTYTSASEEKTIILTQDWSFSHSSPYEEAPKMFVCNVTAKPKENMPAVDANSYRMEVDIFAKVSGILQDGTTSSDYGTSLKRYNSKSLNATNMKAFIKKEHQLFSFSYTSEK